MKKFLVTLALLSMTTLVLGGCLEKLTGTDETVPADETTPAVEVTVPADTTVPAEVPAE
jgi:hypothetical protein